MAGLRVCESEPRIIELSEDSQLTVRRLRHTNPETQGEYGDSVDIRIRSSDGEKWRWTKKGVRFEREHVKVLREILEELE